MLAISSLSSVAIGYSLSKCKHIDITFDFKSEIRFLSKLELR